MNKRILVIGGIVAFALLLVGAAFVGGQLYRAQQQAERNAQQPPRKHVTPASGVPLMPPDGRGQVQRRDGNSIFICDPIDQLSINQDGTVEESASCGPELEVILSHNTVFLHDVTTRQYVQTPHPEGDVVIQQTVEPGSEDDIALGTTLRVWGWRNDDRLVAQTVLYWIRPAPSAPPQIKP